MRFAAGLLLLEKMLQRAEVARSLLAIL